MSELKSKKVEVVKFLMIIIGIIIVMGIVATIITATQPKINYMSSSPTATMNNKSLSNSSVLSSGVYVAGQDFKGGKYNIIAVSGSGNISSSNMYTGGVDGEISSDNNGAYKEYRNINLPNGTKLTISGDVSIKLVENS
ncbi:hypothetical protein [Sarcina ventriculi]|uniref:hypothetical protein n=1 Tax=Sarcina ventriculi TaxID=1267 RepID=UPI0018AB081E|nr:hypothetical protein [Sarcina ventriculi]